MKWFWGLEHKHYVESNDKEQVLFFSLAQQQLKLSPKGGVASTWVCSWNGSECWSIDDVQMNYKEQALFFSLNQQQLKLSPKGRFLWFGKGDLQSLHVLILTTMCQLGDGRSNPLLKDGAERVVWQWISLSSMQCHGPRTSFCGSVFQGGRVVLNLYLPKMRCWSLEEIVGFYSLPGTRDFRTFEMGSGHNFQDQKHSRWLDNVLSWFPGTERDAIQLLPQKSKIPPGGFLRAGLPSLKIHLLRSYKTILLVLWNPPGVQKSFILNMRHFANAIEGSGYRMHCWMLVRWDEMLTPRER